MLAVTPVRPLWPAAASVFSVVRISVEISNAGQSPPRNPETHQSLCRDFWYFTGIADRACFRQQACTAPSVSHHVPRQSQTLHVQEHSCRNPHFRQPDAGFTGLCHQARSTESGTDVCGIGSRSAHPSAPQPDFHASGPAIPGSSSATRRPVRQMTWRFDRDSGAYSPCCRWSTVRL